MTVGDKNQMKGVLIKTKLKHVYTSSWSLWKQHDTYTISKSDVRRQLLKTTLNNKATK